MISLAKIIHSKIVHNILALGFVQVVNYILPLILIPYFMYTLGSEKWGKMAYAQFILQYFIVLVSYGFQWSAVNKISPVREDIAQVNKFFSGYLYAQGILLLISFILLCSLIFFVNSFYEYKYLLLFGFFSVVGVAIFPVWLLQALEELKLMSIIQLVVQLFCFGMTLIFVKSKDDILWAMFFQSINGVLSGIAVLLFLYLKGIKLIRYNILDVKLAFKDGFVLFKSQVWISLYTNTVPVILGMAATANDVATYALADKIQKAIRFVLNPIGRAIFPRISFLYQNSDRNSALRLLKYSLLVTIIIGIIGGLGLFVFSDYVVRALGGETLALASQVVQVFSLMPLIVGLSSTIAIQWLIPIGKENILQKIWFVSAIFVLISSYPIFSLYGVLGAAYLVVTLEIAIVLAMLFVLKKGVK